MKRTERVYIFPNTDDAHHPYLIAFNYPIVGEDFNTLAYFLKTHMPVRDQEPYVSLLATLDQIEDAKREFPHLEFLPHQQYTVFRDDIGIICGSEYAVGEWVRHHEAEYAKAMVSELTEKAPEKDRGLLGRIRTKVLRWMRGWA